MLPPVDPSILSTNPKFDALYQDLCSKKLNQDGTTRVEINSKLHKQQDALNEDLRKARLHSAKRGLVQNGLQDLQYQVDELPEELRELTAILAGALGGEINERDLETVERVLETLEDNIKPIATKLSENFSKDASCLARLITPDGSLSVTNLPGSIQKTQRETENSRIKVAQARLEIAHEISELHILYRQVLETCVRILEQTIHGSIARGAKAKADYLCTVAEGMAGKLGIQREQFMQQIYSPEVQEALQSRADEMEQESRTVKRKIREAEEALEAYGRTRGMDGMASEYAAILKETAQVREEVRRLQDSRP